MTDDTGLRNCLPQYLVATAHLPLRVVFLRQSLRTQGIIHKDEVLVGEDRYVHLNGVWLDLRLLAFTLSGAGDGLTRVGVVHLLRHRLACKEVKQRLRDNLCAHQLLLTQATVRWNLVGRLRLEEDFCWLVGFPWNEYRTDRAFSHHRNLRNDRTLNLVARRVEVTLTVRLVDLKMLAVVQGHVDIPLCLMLVTLDLSVTDAIFTTRL